MTYVVCEPCHECKYTDCVVVCPVECFYQGEAYLAINAERSAGLKETVGANVREKQDAKLGAGCRGKK